jgi:outer membrane protein insertion porin family
MSQMKSLLSLLFAVLGRGLAITLCSAQLVWAADPFSVQDIRVEGLQRVEPGTVFATMPFRVGDVYSDERGADAIRSLFSLGLFNNVRIETQGGVVVVVVEERPIIAAVDLIGTKEFDQDILRKALRDIGLTEGRPFDKAVTDKAEQELKRQYINRSLYAAEVVTTITPLERNRVNLSFNVIEGDVARIKEIRFIGASQISESTLRDQLDLNSGNWMSWYTKSDRYSRSKFNADLETVRSYYLSRGFLEFRIDSTQVSISADRLSMTLTVNIHEGNRFVVSDVRLEGYYLGRDEEFKSLVSIQVGKPYNINQVTESIKAFTDYFGNFGHAFARVESVPEIDRSTNQVRLVLRADPSLRAYVRRINIAGNSRTRDEIIRREIRQLESSWYDGDKIRLSKDRIERLGYLKEVNIDTVEVPGARDQVDLQVNVVEKPTGALQLGAGYSSFEKLFLTFSISQDNILGTGNYLGLQVSTSKYNKFLSISTTDPYYTEDGISRTFEYSHRSSKPYIEQLGNYRLTTDNFGMRYGIPFSEVDRFIVGVAIERTEVDLGTNTPNAYLTYCLKVGCPALAFPISAGWVRDSRDSVVAPTRGVLARAYGELAATGDVQYVRYGAAYQQFIPFGKLYSMALNADIGIGHGFGSSTYPVFKNYYAGGLGSVRGFAQGSLGPRDVTGFVTGGPKKLVLNGEFFVPFPGVGTDKSLRLYGFADAGNVFGPDEPIRLTDLRSSYGAGLSWVSPMGPLRLAIANPVSKQSGDRINRVQFQIGNVF